MIPTVKVSGLDRVAAGLKALPAELVVKRGGPILAGLRKGGAVFRRAWRQEVDRIVAEPNIGGEYVSTGTYRKAITVRRANRRQLSPGASVGVRVMINPRASYPNGMSVGAVAGILEHGHSHMEAKAPMRKAFDAAKELAVDATVAGMQDGIGKELSRLGLGG